jgi:cytochrome c2
MLTATLFLVCCQQKTSNEKRPQVIPFVDSAYTSQKVEEFKKGKVLFYDKCSACHMSPEGTKTGLNILDRVFERLPAPAEEYFAKYIRDGATLRKSGDTYANELYEKFNHTFDHAFNRFSQNDIDQLIVYIKVADKATERGRRLIIDK